MADTFARMRQLIGTTAEWTANDIVIGNGEIAIERLAGGGSKLKVGDGVSKFSELQYFDPGVFSYVLRTGDTMTGPLVAPGVTINAGGLNVSAGNSAFTAPVALGAAATAAEPPGNDNSTRVPTTHWVRGQMSGIITGLNYLGTWNAATNTPPLASGGLGVPTPERGDFYMVSVAGNTNLDGNSTWLAGDFAAFNGIAWQRIPQPLTFDQIVTGLGYTPVNKAGDTMTGNLTPATSGGASIGSVGLPWANIIAQSAFVLNSPTSPLGSRTVSFRTNNVPRWTLTATNAAESGANVGSDIALTRHDDGGASLGNVFSVSRPTGVLTFGISPTAPTPAAGDSTTKLATTAFVAAAAGHVRLYNESVLAAGAPEMLATIPATFKRLQVDFFATLPSVQPIALQLMQGATPISLANYSAGLDFSNNAVTQAALTTATTYWNLGAAINVHGTVTLVKYPNNFWGMYGVGFFQDATSLLAMNWGGVYNAAATGITGVRLAGPAANFAVGSFLRTFVVT